MKTRIIVAVAVLLIFSGSASKHTQAQDSAEPRKVSARVMPQYPAMLRSMNIQGTVRADVVVAPDGKVKSVAVRGGHPMLAQSAENALRQWRWVAAAHESNETVELIFKP